MITLYLPLICSSCLFFNKLGLCTYTLPYVSVNLALIRWTVCSCRAIYCVTFHIYWVSAWNSTINTTLPKYSYCYHTVTLKTVLFLKFAYCVWDYTLQTPISVGFALIIYSLLLLGALLHSELCRLLTTVASNPNPSNLYLPSEPNSLTSLNPHLVNCTKSFISFTLLFIVRSDWTVSNSTISAARNLTAMSAPQHLWSLLYS
jgi:hypothetical protein